MITKNKKGFTLIELIIVIAVIALLASVTFVALDPAKRIGEARNSRRDSETLNIKKALEKYTVDNAGLPSVISALSDDTNYMIAAVGDSAGGSVSCTALDASITKVDISNGTTLIPNYLPTMPVDPTESTPYTNGTGCYFSKTGSTIIDIKPCTVWAATAAESTSAIASISFDGSAGTVDTLSISSVDTDTVDATHVIMGYEKYSKLLTISGDLVTANSRSTVTSANDEIQIEYLSADKVVAAVNDTSGRDTVTDIGDISANPTTWAGDQDMNAALPRYMKLKTLDSTHVVLAYADRSDSDAGKVRVGTVGASTITWGTEATFNTGGTYAIGLAILDDSNFVVTYRDIGDTNNGKARAGSVSGTTITWETAEIDFDTGTVYGYMDASGLSSSKFITMYNDGGDATQSIAIVGTVSGSNITFGTRVDVSTVLSTFNTVETIDSTHAVLVWTNSSNIAKANIATISGNEITMLDTPVSFGTNNIKFPSVTLLDENNFLIGYQDTTVNQSKAIVGSITWE
ncbi:prepilin-type N-terminal cleavage/methylation domain-containing protein [bacterium]|jgi:prepilin-type N-terminal cleavage/methylation domain-containing protein|nr:prepilin-type N-terminal cleavage/methylation domain-containing protein [bacterium]